MLGALSGGISAAASCHGVQSYIMKEVFANIGTGVVLGAGFGTLPMLSGGPLIGCTLGEVSGVIAGVAIDRFVGIKIDELGELPPTETAIAVGRALGAVRAL